MPLSRMKTLERVLLGMAIYTALWVCILWAATSPPAVVDPDCSCAGKTDCGVMHFDVDGTGSKLAHCAIAADSTVCCFE